MIAYFLSIHWKSCNKMHFRIDLLNTNNLTEAGVKQKAFTVLNSHLFTKLISDKTSCIWTYSKIDKTVGFTFQWLLVKQWINSLKTASQPQARLIRSQMTSNRLRMITYSNTKPWITVHFKIYKLNRCTPTAKHINCNFSSKQISQKMHTRDISSMLYSFIISQFSKARPLTAPARTYSASTFTS